MMTPAHPRWSEFYDQLEELLSRWGCSGDGTQLDGKTGAVAPQSRPTLCMSRRLLIEMGCNVEASLAFFRDNGGFCDCEVLLNVEPEPDGPSGRLN